MYTIFGFSPVALSPRRAGPPAITHHRHRLGRRSLPDRALQGLPVGAAHITHAVDEEGRSPRDAAAKTPKQVTLDLPCVAVLRHVLTEALGVETEGCGVLAEMLIIKGTLMLEEGVMHLPELAVGRRGLGRFRRVLGMGVDVAQGEVPVDETQLVTQLALQSLDDMVGKATVRALVIGVLDQCHRCSGWSLHVISGIDQQL
jgi:hypothetical protein